jgi:hypothetical protein
LVAFFNIYGLSNLLVLVVYSFNVLGLRRSLRNESRLRHMYSLEIAGDVVTGAARVDKGIDAQS